MFLYAGVEQIGRATETLQLSRRDTWKNAVRDNGWNLTIEIASTHVTRADAENGLVRALASRPTAPLISSRKSTSQAVRRVGTEDVFASQGEAAIAYGISVGALSNHLNGRKGYETVHGLTFERVAG